MEKGDTLRKEVEDYFSTAAANRSPLPQGDCPEHMRRLLEVEMVIPVTQSYLKAGCLAPLEDGKE